MSIVRLPEYEAEFEPEVFEIYALPRSDANGASPYLEKYHRPLVSTDAILDTRTGVLDRSEGILTWIIEGLDDRWGYSFEPHGVYKLLVKKAKPLEDLGYMRPSWNNRYYDDDDIFWGHCIIANIDAEGNPVHADIAG